MRTAICFPGGGAAGVLPAMGLATLFRQLPSIRNSCIWGGASAGAVLATHCAIYGDEGIIPATRALMERAKLVSVFPTAVDDVRGFLTYVQSQTTRGVGILGPPRNIEQLRPVLERWYSREPIKAGHQLAFPVLLRKGPIIHYEPTIHGLDLRVERLLQTMTAPGYFAGDGEGVDGGLADNSGLISAAVALGAKRVITFILRRYTPPTDATILHAAATAISAMLRAQHAILIEALAAAGVEMHVIDLSSVADGIALDDMSAAISALDSTRMLLQVSQLVATGLERTHGK